MSYQTQESTNLIFQEKKKHIAGTEFIIRPLFVVNGVLAPGLFIGLLIGNILTVLSWALYTD